MEGESINLNITTTIKCIRLFFPRVTQTNLPNSHYQVKDTQLIAPANIYFPSLTHNPKAKIAANINFVSLTPDPTAHSSGSNLSPPPSSSRSHASRAPILHASPLFGQGESRDPSSPATLSSPLSLSTPVCPGPSAPPHPLASPFLSLPACATDGRPGEAPPGSRGRLRVHPDLHGGVVAVTKPRRRATPVTPRTIHVHLCFLYPGAHQPPIPCCPWGGVEEIESWGMCRWISPTVVAEAHGGAQVELLLHWYQVPAC
jgi:hypothetical protein